MIPTGMQSLTDVTKQRERDVNSRGLVRVVSCSYRAVRGDADALEYGGAAGLYRQLWPQSLLCDRIERAFAMQARAVVPAGNTLTTGWLSELLPDLSGGFIEFARETSLLARIGGRRTPFDTSVSVSTSGASGFAFVGAGKPKALARQSLANSLLRPAVVSGILVVTDELMRLAKPGSEDFLRADLAAGLNAYVDGALVDPSNAGTADLAPASITNGVTAVTSSAGDALEDLRNVVQAFVADGGQVQTAVILMSSQNAVGLALRAGANNAPMFPGLDATGGTIGGLRCVASDVLDDQIVCIDASKLLVADDGAVNIAFSRQATLEMLDNPTNNSSEGTPTSQVSMWQTNSVALRVEREINWTYVGAIGLVDGANYLSEGGSPA